MAYSDSFPAIRPSFQFSADAGRLDSRISYSRSTTGTYFGTAKHLSSDNLLLQSSDFDTTWTTQGLTLLTGGQTDPAGGTDGFTLVEDSATSFHRVDQSMSASGELAFVVYAKRKSGTRYLNLAFYTPANSQSAGLATFDLLGGATHTSNGSSSTLTSLSATQTASGNGFYKCVFKATGSGPTYVSIGLSDVAAPVANNYGLVLYTGDGTSSIDIAFASLTTTGATDYNATTTQIHREYAPTLQTAAINAPRFEYSPTDSASAAMGESRGLLIEGQATNINTYSKGGVNGSGVVQWQVDNGSATGNSAVGPDGTLSALHFVPNTTTTAHYAYNNAGSTPSGSTPHTISVYAKAAGYSDIVIRLTSSYSAFANTINATFTLTGDGSVSVTGGTATAAIESCGNGWYRCQVTETTGSSPTGMRPYIYARQVASYAGDGFSGVLLWGWQIEANSFASSFVDTGTSGSTATRAADSASAPTADIGLTAGQDVTLYVEGDFGDPANKPNNRLAAALQENSNSYLLIYNGSANSGSGYVRDGGTDQAYFASGITAGAFKSAIAATNNSFKYAANGTSSTEDTAGTLPKYNTLRIGGQSVSGVELDGHIKRVAVYSQSLSSTELAAITS